MGSCTRHHGRNGTEEWGGSVIDRETAIQWANEAGMINFGGANWQCVTDQIQQIITRAQNEALEASAKIAETPIIGEQDDITMEAKDRTAKEIRALKQELPK